MRKKIIIKIMILILLATVIGVMSYNLLKDDSNQSVVFIAVHEIEIHSIVSNSDIKMVTIDQNAKETFFEKAYDSKQDILGTVTTRVILKDEVFTEKTGLVKDTDEHDVINEMGEVNNSVFLSGNDRIGFISIDKKNALGGMVEKGNYIDIIYTSQTEDTGGLYTYILLQKVPVYKVTQNSTSSSLVDIHFTITPEQGTLLTLAKYTGHLDFLLSNEAAPEFDGMPKLPEDLYAKLLEAGYLLTGESNAEMQVNMTEGEIEKELDKAQQRLTEAIAAMNLAKSALNKEPELSLEEVVKSLESAVRDLESTVNNNTELLEGMGEKDE